MTIPVLPRLAVGSHSDDSGYACAANVLCWEQGEPITGEPAGVSPYLSDVVRFLNDHVCTEPEQDGWITVLCPDCSTAVLGVAHRILGTAANGYSTAWLAELVRNERYGMRDGDPAITARIDTAIGDLLAGDDIVFTCRDSSVADQDSDYERYRQMLVTCAPVYYGRMYMQAHSGTGHLSVEAAHLLVDAWETVTGRRSTAPTADVVQRALRMSGATQ